MKDGNIIFTILSALLLCLISSSASARQINEAESIILEGSKLRINGTSNVTDFECIYSSRISSDTLHQTITYGDSLFITGDSIKLSSSSFDCGKRAINRDLQKTLKSDEFPFLEIGLVSIEIADSVPFETKISVTIAGVSRNELVEISEFSSSKNSISFAGESSILLTNFGLTPPTALFGLVKVGDEIKISFDLTVEQ
tara:strand:- start:18089 stop:18682 length:594 start_codon:yes stop_codon:yes gene_type:complete